MKESNYTKFDLLDEQRVDGFVRVMTQLQAEGINVEKSKTTFNSLLNDVKELSRTEGGIS